MTFTAEQKFTQISNQGGFEVSSKIPFCQFITPNGKTQKELEKAVCGLYIGSDQAELAGLTPDDNWGTIDHYDSGSGFLAKRIRIVSIHTSAIEVGEKVERNGKTFTNNLGAAYGKGGKLTTAGAIARQQSDDKVQKKTHIFIKRQLLAFLNEKNELIVQSPVKITTRGIFGVSFGEEFNALYTSFDKVVAKLKNEPNAVLSPHLKPLVVMCGTLGFFKETDPNKSASCCFVGTFAPVALTEHIGLIKEYQRSKEGRKCVITGKFWDELFVAPEEESGKKILQWYKDYSTFSTLYESEEDSEVDNETGEVSNAFVPPSPKGDRNHYTKVAQNTLAELGWDEVKTCLYVKNNYGQIEWKTLPEDKLIQFVGDLQSQVLNDQGF